MKNKNQFFLENRKGMSAVVTTLIIILLVIVALGIIWVVVRNVITSGQEQVELGEKCRAVEISAVKMQNTTAGGTAYDLTLSRTGTGEEVIGGVKIVLANSTDYSDVLDFGIALAPLETKTQSLTLTNPIINANKIEMTPYFISDLGEEQLCPNTVTKEF